MGKENTWSFDSDLQPKPETYKKRKKKKGRNVF